MALSPNMNVMIRAAEQAGRSLVRDFGEVEQLQVSRKGPGDFVTAADLRAEEIIFEALKKARPDYAFLMEERGASGDEDYEYRWIVDPLDGTMNFMHGIPHWNISIGLEYQGEIVAGVIHDPVKDELFRAEKGNGAFMRHKRLRVSGRNKFEGATILAGAPAGGDASRELFLQEYNEIYKICRGIRRFGAAALDLAYVAAGRAEIYWERKVNPWDIAAGLIIVKEAGGMVTDVDTHKSPLQTNAILAGNTELFNDFKKLLRTTKKEQDAA